MKKILIISICILNLNTSFAFENLNNGVGLSNEAVEAQLYETSTPYAIARQGQRSINKRSVQAYIDLGASVYSISSGLDLIETKSSDRTLLGHWPLTPYPNHLYLSGEYSSAYKALAAVHDETVDAPSDPSAIVNRDVLYTHDSYSETINQFGCLQKTPLRYGDINGDNINELILFLGEDMIVFSTALNEVIFSGHYWLNDELDADEAVRHFPGELKAADPQYIAYSGTDVLVREKFPAKRSYSKYYFGQFNGDEQHDIVVWRKLYQSRLRSNPETGFDKLGEALVHYSLIDGRYQLQQTEPADIKAWLDSKQLTWQKGYPSQSECPGQENQLIPEMHDPLLNDADVLK